MFSPFSSFFTPDVTFSQWRPTAVTGPRGNQELTGSMWLHSSSSSYQVLSVLGRGAFSKVAKCKRMDDNKTVAIKMMKNKDYFYENAKEEVAALMKIQKFDSDTSNLVKWNKVFIDRGNICLEFEHLDKSLFEFMKGRSFKPLPLEGIRPIVKQLANALDHLKTAGIIHADLKLDNIMLVNQLQEPYKVKVIDFGLACERSATQLGSYIQTRQYRSPEVILGHRFNEAIDMWSLGCVAAELYLGRLLYPGCNEYDMMRHIVQTQGQPPDDILNSGIKTNCFFSRDFCSSSLWRLKAPMQFYIENGIQMAETKCMFTSLDDLLHFPSQDFSKCSSTDKAAKTTDVQMFVNMLKGMLHLDACFRMTPRQVLDHPFTTMCHLKNLHSTSSHVKSCFEFMGICPIKPSGIWGVVSESVQSSVSRTEHSVQSLKKTKITDDDNDRGSAFNKWFKALVVDYDQHSSTYRGLSHQTKSWIHSGNKGKFDDDDDENDRQTVLNKCFKAETEEHDGCSILHPGSSNQNISCIQSGKKRKFSEGGYEEQSYQNKQVKTQPAVHQRRMKSLPEVSAGVQRPADQPPDHCTNSSNSSPTKICILIVQKRKKCRYVLKRHKGPQKTKGDKEKKMAQVSQELAECISKLKNLANLLRDVNKAKWSHRAKNHG